MVWLIVILAVIVAGIAWLAAQGKLGGMPPLVDDRPGPDLPDSDITAQGLRDIRFAVTSRGYSMAQVDALIDRLADQLDGRTYRPVDEHMTWERQAGPDSSPTEPADQAEPDQLQDAPASLVADPDEPPSKGSAGELTDNTDVYLANTDKAENAE